MGTRLNTLAAARAAFRTTWYEALHCFSAFTWSASLASPCSPCASGTSPGRSDRERLHLRVCSTTPHHYLQTLAGRTIGEHDFGDYELRSQQAPAAAVTASTPLSRCVSDPPPRAR